MLKHVSEAVRERETFRHEPSLITTTRYNDSRIVVPNHEIFSAEDTVLTALAQLGALKTECPRALISLFDKQHQYIVAEATPNLPLGPSLDHEKRNGEVLLMCGTAVPRGTTLCELTLTAQTSDMADTNSPLDLPIVVINNPREDPRLWKRPECLPSHDVGFFAGVPIRSARGINIGVFCVMSENPLELVGEWDPRYVEVMREISAAIMGHLESRRAKDAHRRAERMTRGVGSFIEKKASLTGWEHGPHAAAFSNVIGLEGQLNIQQQDLQHRKEASRHRSGDYGEKDSKGHTSQQPGSSISLANSGPDLPRRHSSCSDCSIGFRPRSISSPVIPTASSTPPLSSTNPGPPSQASESDHIFSRAANVIREAVETEGFVFLDASVRSFGALVGQSKNPINSQVSPYISSSDSEENSSSMLNGDDDMQPCRVLAFSTSEFSSINSDRISRLIGHLPERLLAVLLRRFPRGKIFNFDETGALQSETSEDETQVEITTPENEQGPGKNRRLLNPFARHLVLGHIVQAFPGARSVAFVPIWDHKKERWCAGGFAYTFTPTRVFTMEGELSYLRAFGILVMSELHRKETALASKAKSDALASLSHELRSPLHGVILGIELLSDTSLNVFQQNTLHSLETCGRTLLDVIDHLLDFSKINHYTNNQKQDRGLRLEDGSSIEGGMKNRQTDVRIDALAEEVVESVFAGHSFQSMTMAQSGHPTNIPRDARCSQFTDTTQAMGEPGWDRSDTAENEAAAPVSISFDIKPGPSYYYHTAAGAIRRIFMNLFANSLKYTDKGSVQVSIVEDAALAKKRKISTNQERIVRITVADTGRGIAADYLRNDVFKPFSQENPLSPGTGLGLSLVHRIVKSLRGETTIESEREVGTTVTIILPLLLAVPQEPENVVSGPAFDGDPEFTDERAQLKGLRVRFMRSQSTPACCTENENTHRPGDYVSTAENICRDWLQMEPISEVQASALSPDVLICDEAVLDNPAKALDTQMTRQPVIVVCHNAVRACQRTLRHQKYRGQANYDFISQPTGARKLARVLLLALKRWVEVQNMPPVSPEHHSYPSVDTLDLNSISRLPGEIPLNGVLPALADGLPLHLPKAFEQQIVPRGKAATLTPETHDQPPEQPGPTEILPLVRSSRNTDLPGGSVPTHSQPLIDDDSRFLLVDDNPINLRMLCAYMKKLGREYTTAVDGQEAVDSFKADPRSYCCILMDINMPRLDGMQATQQIRKYERDQEVNPRVILALSGLNSQAAQADAFASGIDLFLTKPVRLKELSGILRARKLL